MAELEGEHSSHSVASVDDFSRSKVWFYLEWRCNYLAKRRKNTQVQSIPNSDNSSRLLGLLSPMTTKSLSSLPQNNRTIVLTSPKTSEVLVEEDQIRIVMWNKVHLFRHCKKQLQVMCWYSANMVPGFDQLRRWLAIYPNIPQPIDLGLFFAPHLFSDLAGAPRESTQASQMVGRLVDVSSQAGF